MLNPQLCEAAGYLPEYLAAVYNSSAGAVVALDNRGKNNSFTATGCQHGQNRHNTAPSVVDFYRYVLLIVAEFYRF